MEYFILCVVVAGICLIGYIPFDIISAINRYFREKRLKSKSKSKSKPKSKSAHLTTNEIIELVKTSSKPAHLTANEIIESVKASIDQKENNHE